MAAVAIPVGQLLLLLLLLLLLWRGIGVSGMVHRQKEVEPFLFLYALIVCLVNAAGPWLWDEKSWGRVWPQ